jgi:hypothetical protein
MKDESKAEAEEKNILDMQNSWGNKFYEHVNLPCKLRVKNYCGKCVYLWLHSGFMFDGIFILI